MIFHVTDDSLSPMSAFVEAEKISEVIFRMGKRCSVVFYSIGEENFNKYHYPRSGEGVMNPNFSLDRLDEAECVGVVLGLTEIGIKRIQPTPVKKWNL